MIPDSIRSILKRALKAYGGADGARALQWLNTQPIEPLTRREMEVVRLVGQGCTNQEIAEMLTIEAITVKDHLYHTYGKLGIRNRAQLVVWAIRRGIVVLSEEEDEDD